MLTILTSSTDSLRILKTTYTNDEGKFYFDNLNDDSFWIKTSSLEYQKAAIYVKYGDTFPIGIQLKKKVNSLESVTIVHKSRPVIIKKDTAVFKLSKFIRSDDRKIKDLVDRLPGIYIDSGGNLFFKGKPISKLRIDNEDFFGGAVQLGIDNIPADAIEKIEIIDNVLNSNIDLGSSFSKTQVINLVLKKNKKNIFFGEIKAGLGLREFYNVKPTLFYFSKNLQTHTLAKVDNLNNNFLKTSDVRSFSSGYSTLFRLPEIEYQNNRRDVFEIKNKSFLNNTNFNLLEGKLDVITFYNNSSDQFKKESVKNYISNNLEERREDRENSKNRNIATKISFDKKDKNYELKVGLQLFNYMEDKSANTSSQITTPFNVNDFYKLKNTNFSTYTDVILKLNDQLILNTGFLVAYDKKDVNKTINSNNIFFSDIINWEANPSFYELKNDRKNDRTTLKTGADLIYNTKSSITWKLSSTIEWNKTEITNQYDRSFNTTRNFIFNNGIKDLEINVSPSFIYEKPDFTIEATLLASRQTINKEVGNFDKVESVNVLPSVAINYTINQKKGLSFSYSRSAQFPTQDSFNETVLVNSFDSVNLNDLNPELQTMDSFNFSYSDLNINNNYSFTLRNSYSRSENDLINRYNLNDQFIENSYEQSKQRNLRNILRSRLMFFGGNNKYELGAFHRYSERQIFTDALKDLNTNNYGLDFKINTNSKLPVDFLIGSFYKWYKQKIANKNSSFNSYGYSVVSKARLNKKLNAQALFTHTFFSKTDDNLNLNLDATYRFKDFDFNLSAANLLDRNILFSYDQTDLYIYEEQVNQIGSQVMLNVTYYF